MFAMSSPATKLDVPSTSSTSKLVCIHLRSDSLARANPPTGYALTLGPVHTLIERYLPINFIAIGYYFHRSIRKKHFRIPQQTFEWDGNFEPSSEDIASPCAY